MHTGAQFSKSQRFALERPLGSLLGSLGGFYGTSSDALGRSWAPLGAPLTALGRLLGALGSLLDRSWAHLGALGWSLDALWALSGRFGDILGHTGALLR